MDKIPLGDVFSNYLVIFPATGSHLHFNVVLYCIVLYCIVLVLHCVAVHCVAVALRLRWVGLRCVGLGWVALGWVGLRWVAWRWVGLGWVGLGCVGLGCVALRCIALYCIVLYCIVLIGACISIISNQLKAPHGDERFEACCQWEILNVQIITLLFPFTVQKYIYPPVNKVHDGSFSCCP